MSFMLSATNEPLIVECHYAECRYAECRGTHYDYFANKKVFTINQSSGSLSSIEPLMVFIDRQVAIISCHLRSSFNFLPF